MTSVAADVGMRIRTARMDQHWSQDRLAEATGFRQASISRWEMGERSMTVEQLIVVADAMGLEAASLLPGSPQAEQSLTIGAAKLADQLRATADLIDTRLTAPQAATPQ